MSDEEGEELFDYIRNAGRQELLKEEIMEIFRRAGAEAGADDVDWDALFSRIGGGRRAAVAEKTRVIKAFYRKRVAAAVLALLLCGFGVYILLHRTPAPGYAAENTPEKTDVLPGSAKAVLTLSNGTSIILDSARKEKVAIQGQVNVMKSDSGMLAYDRLPRDPRSSVLHRQPVQYNTLTTPRGGLYRLTLSDGTKVWLNAASSIHYPVAFNGNERKVEITGEVYFEVAKDAAKPFIVSKGNAEVKVLGTDFNINAYDDESTIRVTVLEGLIKVSQASYAQLVHPGQQAELNKAGQIKLLKDVRTGDVISWKNGFFSFRNDNLRTVMRKLARWYDVDVIYEPGVNNEQHFSGMIDKSLTLLQVLNGLEQAKAHVRIEGRKVTILP